MKFELRKISGSIEGEIEVHTIQDLKKISDEYDGRELHIDFEEGIVWINVTYYG